MFAETSITKPSECYIFEHFTRSGTPAAKFVDNAIILKQRVSNDLFIASKSYFESTST